MPSHPRPKAPSRPRAGAACVAGFLLLIGSGPARAGDSAESTIVGVPESHRLLAALADSYARENGRRLALAPQALGTGGTALAVGRRDAALAMRFSALTQGERAHGLTETPYGAYPVAFFVHPDLPVEELDGATLGAVFSGQVTNWREIGGPDLRVRVVAREETSPLLAALRQALPLWPRGKLAPRSLVAVTPDEAAEAVQRHPGAIGFGTWCPTLPKKVRVLRLDGHLPGSANYPVWAELRFLRRADERADAPSHAFIAYARSESGRTIGRRFGLAEALPP